MDQAVARPASSTQVDIGPLGNSLGFVLRMAQLKIFEHYFTELTDFDLKPGEFSVLCIIMHNPGIRQGVLAQRLLIKRAHMTKLIRTLEARGYVERAIPDEDRRSVTLDLTEDGRQSVERHWTRFERYDRLPKGRFSQQKERQLVRLLQDFVGLDEGGAA